MTRNDDFIGQLEAYLDDYDGETPLPDAVRDAVRAQLPTTKQIGHTFGPMRYLSMTMILPAPAKYALAAAVVAVVALLGIRFLGPGDNFGSASPTPTPTATPVTIEPLSTAEGSTAEGNRRLAAGTYSVDLPLGVTFEVPEGWNYWAYTSAATQINLVKGPTSGELSLEIVDNVSADPCTDEMLDPPVGPSVDDLVSAISNLEGFDVTAATDVTVDGFSGKQLTMTAPDTDALCEGFATWRTTTRQNGVGPGEGAEVRIIDVDGVRLLISIAHAAPLSAVARSEIHGIVDSLQLGP